MNQQINGLAAVGGCMIIMGFISYVLISYALSYLLFIFGGILFVAGIMTLNNKEN